MFFICIPIWAWKRGIRGVVCVGMCPQWRLRPSRVGIFVAIIVPKDKRDKPRPVKSVEKLSKIGPLCMPDSIFCTLVLFYFDLEDWKFWFNDLRIELNRYQKVYFWMHLNLINSLFGFSFRRFFLDLFFFFFFFKNQRSLLLNAINYSHS